MSSSLGLIHSSVLLFGIALVVMIQQIKLNQVCSGLGASLPKVSRENQLHLLPLVVDICG